MNKFDSNVQLFINDVMLDGGRYDTKYINFMQVHNMRLKVIK